MDKPLEDCIKEEHQKVVVDLDNKLRKRRYPSQPPTQKEGWEDFLRDLRRDIPSILFHKGLKQKQIDLVMTLIKEEVSQAIYEDRAKLIQRLEKEKKPKYWDGDAAYESGYENALDKAISIIKEERA
jgi:hypothetical protein